MRFLTLLCLIASTALGQVTAGDGGAGSASSPVSYGPAAATQLYVDFARGSDANTCRAPLKSACKTFQRAFNAAPKNLRGGLVVNVSGAPDGGVQTYDAGAYLTGFSFDPGFQQTSGGIYVKGGYVTIRWGDGGTATGTATAATLGSTPTFGTLVDSSQGWTTNELRGYFVHITGGTGLDQRRVVSSNNGTTVTVVGAWATTPDAGSTYAIEKPNVLVSATVPFPPSGLFASLADMGGLVVYGNRGFEYRNGAITIEGIDFTNAAGAAVSHGDNSGLAMNFVRATGAGSSTLYNNTLNSSPRVSIADCYHLGSSSQATLTPTAGASFVVNRVLSQNASSLMNLSNASGAAVNAFLTDSESLNTTNGVVCAAGATCSVIGCRLGCASSSGTGVLAGSNSSAVNASGRFGTAHAAVNTVNVDSTCGIGVLAFGINGFADLSTVTGSPSVTGMLANWGGRIHTASVTMTGGTQDVSLDNGQFVSAFSTITKCQLADAGVSAYGSAVCK